MTDFFRRAVVAVLAVTVLSVSSPAVVQAEIIGTLTALENEQRASDLQTINSAFARDEVRQQLKQMGVEPAQLDARLAALTDSEIRTLAQQIESAPVGAGALEVVGIVFLVLLILELVGVLDIFKKFP